MGTAAGVLTLIVTIIWMAQDFGSDVEVPEGSVVGECVTFCSGIHPIADWLVPKGELPSLTGVGDIAPMLSDGGIRNSTPIPFRLFLFGDTAGDNLHDFTPTLSVDSELVVMFQSTIGTTICNEVSWDFTLENMSDLRLAVAGQPDVTFNCVHAAQASYGQQSELGTYLRGRIFTFKVEQGTATFDSSTIDRSQALVQMSADAADVYGNTANYNYYGSMTLILQGLDMRHETPKRDTNVIFQIGASLDYTWPNTTCFNMQDAYIINTYPLMSPVIYYISDSHYLNFQFAHNGLTAGGHVVNIVPPTSIPIQPRVATTETKMDYEVAVGHVAPDGTVTVLSTTESVCDLVDGKVTHIRVAFTVEEDSPLEDYGILRLVFQDIFEEVTGAHAESIDDGFLMSITEDSQDTRNPYPIFVAASTTLIPCQTIATAADYLDSTKLDIPGQTWLTCDP